MKRLQKALACAATAVSLIGVCTSSAQAVQQPDATQGDGFWAWTCQDGRACVEGINMGGLPPWWNFDGCGFHAFYIPPFRGWAHGNAFRVTYQDNRWDDVEPWTTRYLDSHNDAKYVYVYC